MIPWASPVFSGIPVGGFRRPPLLSLLGGGVPSGLPGLGVLSGNKGEALTFTRATTKTVQNAAGLVLSVGSGLPGVDYRGLSCEAAHTNLILQSQAFDDAAWTKQPNAVVVPNALAAPDGTITADLLTVTNDDNGYIYQLIVGPTGSFAPSFWINRVSTSGVLWIQNPASNAFGDWRVDLALLGPGWVRVTGSHPAVTVLAAFSDSGSVSGWRMDAIGPPSIQFGFWGTAYESGTYSHSYVPTTAAAATANKDQATLPTTTLPVSPGAFKFNFTPLWSSGAAGVKTLLDTRNSGTSDSGFCLYFSGDALNFITGTTGASTSTNSGALSWTAGRQYQVRATWGAGSVFVYRDGVLVASNTTGTAPMPANYGAGLFVGIDYPVTNPLDGFISDLRFFTV